MGRKYNPWRQDKTGSFVKLIEPSSGRIVELQVTDKRFYEAYMRLLMTYAEQLEKENGAKWKVIENTIRIELTDDELAETVRQKWR